MLKTLSAALAGAALIAAPTMASAAPANPAASLSVAKSVRASGVQGKEKLAGGGLIIALVAAAAVVAGVVIVASDDDDSDSN
jgi:hypothetical protein